MFGHLSFLGLLSSCLRAWDGPQLGLACGIQRLAVDFAVHSQELLPRETWDWPLRLAGGRRCWKPPRPWGSCWRGVPHCRDWHRPLCALLFLACGEPVLSVSLLLTRVTGGLRSWASGDAASSGSSVPLVPGPQCARTFRLSPCSGAGRQAGKVRLVDPPLRAGCSCGHMTRTPESEAGLEAGVASRPVP